MRRDSFIRWAVFVVREGAYIYAEFRECPDFHVRWAGGSDEFNDTDIDGKRNFRERFLPLTTDCY